MTKQTEADKKEKIREKKVTAALHALSCVKCHHYTAYPKVDKEKPAERVDWTLNKQNHFNVLHPLKEQTGQELCYLCQKIEDKLVKEINA